MRRRRREPDDRPDWRDPDMPIIRGNKLYSAKDDRRFATIGMLSGAYD